MKITISNNMVEQTEAMAKEMKSFAKIINKVIYNSNRLKRALHAAKVHARKARR